MGSDAEAADGPSSTLKLPLFSIPPGMQSPEHPGMLTPPLYTSASVPFRWEEEPGKPRPCTDLIPLPSPNTNTNNSRRSLELPPRLLMLEYSKIPKTPSPTTVLDGPYESNSNSKGMVSSSSFRFVRENKGSSFRGSRGGSPESGQLRCVVLGNEKTKHKGRALFGFWGQKTRGKNDIGDGSIVFSSSSLSSMNVVESGSSSARVNMDRIKRNGSFSRLSQARSHLWASIYGGLKQAIPWSKKSNKGLSFELSL